MCVGVVASCSECARVCVCVTIAVSTRAVCVGGGASYSYDAVVFVRRRPEWDVVAVYSQVRALASTSLAGTGKAAFRAAETVFLKVHERARRRCALA